jgi:hypothetical protein
MSLADIYTNSVVKILSQLIMIEDFVKNNFFFIAIRQYPMRPLTWKLYVGPLSSIYGERAGSEATISQR